MFIDSQSNVRHAPGRVHAHASAYAQARAIICAIKQHSFICMYEDTYLRQFCMYRVESMIFPYDQ